MLTKNLSFLLCCLPWAAAMASAPIVSDSPPEGPRQTLDVRTLAKAQRAYDEGVLRAKLSSALVGVKADSTAGAPVKSGPDTVPVKLLEQKEVRREQTRLVSVFGTQDALVAEARLPSGHVKSLRVNDVLEDCVIKEITPDGVVVRKKNTEPRFLAVGSRF